MDARMGGRLALVACVAMLVGCGTEEDFASLDDPSALEEGLAVAPALAFTPGGDRTLIAVNNPEQLVVGDLGDPRLGDKSIMRVTGVTGKIRNWFEHVNRTGLKIGYGIMIYNPNSYSVNVTVHGQGFIANSYGGKPFVTMFSNYSTVGSVRTIKRNGVLWVWRNDEAVIAGNFFSGVIDFDVDGPVVVDNIAYDTFKSLDGSRSYLGYVQRIEPDGTHEARVYKGTCPHSEVSAQLDYTLGDTDVAGPLPVSYPNFDLVSGTYGTPITRSGWMSNIGPGQNVNAVTNDMATWNMPGWGLIDPLQRSDGEGKYPNLGNWLLTYVIRGTITNNGTTARQVSLNLRTPGGSSPIAYQGADGVWRDQTIPANTTFAYRTFTVPAGSSQAYEARYILGGPGAGALTNTITLDP